MQLFSQILFLIFALLFTPITLSEENKQKVAEKTTQQVAEEARAEVLDTEAYKVGVMVQSVQEALNIKDEAALQTIIFYGTDSRYYSMIRGWLFQELVGVESQLHASKKKKNIDKFQRESNFLKKAIRLVDLE